MKRKAICLAMMTAFLLFSACSNKKPEEGGNKEDPPSAEKKPIDIYLLAGQSNAAGYSPIQNNQTETFDNVTYAGMTDVTLIGSSYSRGTDYLSSPNKYVHGVRGGLGYDSTHIGPEYGMAKAINDDYEDKEVMILKTAAGGTTLADVNSNLSGVFGNWYPRSLWPNGYEPNIVTASKDNKATGILYKLFVENIKTVYNQLVADNYEPTFVGVAWAQGESDADLGANGISKYGETLEVFINDLRQDIAELTGDEWYEDYLPFAIMKIATSYVSYNRQANLQLINQQNNVAHKMENVETVETSDLLIKLSDGSRNVGVEDDWHFNFNDMTTLGERFIETINGMEL